MENQRISSENYVSAWNLGGLVVTQMALKAAIELNVFNIIANSGPGTHLTSKEIVSQISTKNPNVAAANLKRILRVLSVHSLLSVQRPSSSGKTMQEETYGLTKETLWLVPNEDGVSLAPFILLFSEMDMVKSLSMLKDTVLEPGCLPFNKAYGMSIYKYLSEKPDLSQLFNKGVGQSSILDFEEVLKVYKGFEEVEELMDVGGGDGMTISKVVSRYPHIHGINFDLPNVIVQGTAKYQTGVKYVGGDMFQLIPNAQSILLKWVLHNWNDDLCKKILKRCWEALPKTGKVIVVEFAIPEILEKTEEVKKIVALDVVMMATPGGKERTIAEFDDLSKAAGFVETKIFSISNGCYVLEFHKVETY
ncbi:putative (S)-scoulerine 9-O-methyltransferase [Rosa chinensis]|uniref:Putative (S)-scoulerine 9-O-methyltransferase n=1 Tax=Rosa chinensis TaxID=74649 RepID=A0A2P6PA32_ROSCH|nr:(S)-scoulerine 9-O-methyltransferase-like [Rosa chinensis]PRQ18787.1 putative (S)-scoulerine 9-O-methyltransferase [Rosa chinensis]